VRVALGLWIVWAIVGWNVVFDHEVEVAGRHYIHAAALAAESGGPYARIDDWMRPAMTRGIRKASVGALAILVVAVAGVGLAGRRPGS
jgi:hypothetical protein